MTNINLTHKFRVSKVEARQFSCTELCEQESLADWFGGRLRGITLPAEYRIIQYDFHDTEFEAQFGDYLVKSEGFRAHYTADEFLQLFEPLETSE